MHLSDFLYRAANETPLDWEISSEGLPMDDQEILDVIEMTRVLIEETYENRPTWVDAFVRGVDTPEYMYMRGLDLAYYSAYWFGEPNQRPTLGTPHLPYVETARHLHETAYTSANTQLQNEIGLAMDFLVPSTRLLARAVQFQQYYLDRHEDRVLIPYELKGDSHGVGLWYKGILPIDSSTGESALEDTLYEYASVYGSDKLPWVSHTYVQALSEFHFPYERIGYAIRQEEVASFKDEENDGNVHEYALVYLLNQYLGNVSSHTRSRAELLNQPLIDAMRVHMPLTGSPLNNGYHDVRLFAEVYSEFADDIFTMLNMYQVDPGVDE